MTIDDLTSRMENHYLKIVIQNDGNNNPDYEPYIGTVEDFRESDLYNQIADAEVTDVYAEPNGTIWICYYHDETEDEIYVSYVDREDQWS